MGRQLFPPVYVNVSAWLVYEADLPASVLRTAIRIFGLGWRHQYEWTDEVTLPELCELCDLSRRQVFAHLRILVNRGVLCYTYSRSVGIYVFDLRPARRRAREVDKDMSAVFRTDDALSVVVDSPLSEKSLDSSEEEEKEQQQHTSSLKGGSGGDGAECGKSHSVGAGESGKPDWTSIATSIKYRASEAAVGSEWARGLRLEALERMGVLEPTRSEIAGLKWASVGYLIRWLFWLEDQDEVGVGLVIQQMRRGEEAPVVVDRQVLEREHRRRKYEEWGVQT